MDDQEIGDRIGELTGEQRDVLYMLCEARHTQPGGETAVYRAVSAAIGKVLHDKHLVWLFVPTQAAARYDVYVYWKKHVHEE